MVRADQAGSGVMFSIDTETGFPDVVVINAAWGLGENVVQGAVNPDEYRVFKPLLDEGADADHRAHLGAKEKKMIYAGGSRDRPATCDTRPPKALRFVLTDDEILTLARWAAIIERHYDQPMDMEWAKDGETGELFIVQARPETVQSQKEAETLKSYTLRSAGRCWSVGSPSARPSPTGPAQVLDEPRRDRPLQGGLDPRHRHDRPGLGADHEAGLGDRHRPRRAHQPCRHRQPRDGLPRSSGPATPRTAQGRSGSHAPAPRARRATSTTARSTST